MSSKLFPELGTLRAREPIDLIAMGTNKNKADCVLLSVRWCVGIRTHVRMYARWVGVVVVACKAVNEECMGGAAGCGHAASGTV